MTTETKVAKNSIGKGAVAKTQENKPKTIYDVIRAGEKNFAAALPKHINSERFVRIALTQIRTNPNLAKCSQESLLGALMTLAQLGLEPGVLGQAYLIPFNNKKLGTTECQLQLSYKGMIELLRRSGQLKDIYAYPVYENDFFKVKYGLKRDLEHEPADGERGDVKGFYSVAVLKDETYAFEYMTKSEVVQHEEKYRKGSYKNDIWNKNFEEMALKTVTKKMLKWLPISVEMIENLRKEENVQRYDEKTNEVNEEDINTIEVEAVEDVETVVSDVEKAELLKEAGFIKGFDIIKEAKTVLKVDFETMTESQFKQVRELLDKKLEENM